VNAGAGLPAYNPAVLLNFLLALLAAAMLVLSFPCSTPEVQVPLPHFGARQIPALSKSRGLPAALEQSVSAPPPTVATSQPTPAPLSNTPAKPGPATAPGGPAAPAKSGSTPAPAGQPAPTEQASQHKATPLPDKAPPLPDKATPPSETLTTPAGASASTAKPGPPQTPAATDHAAPAAPAAPAEPTAPPSTARHFSLPPSGLRKIAKPLTIPAFPAPGKYAQFAWLAFAALLPLLLIARRSTPLAAFGWGYFAGILWLAFHLDWIGSFGLVPVVLLSAFFALPIGLFTYLAHWVIRARQPAWVAWGLPALWTALEFLRSFGFWAFPWNLLGYSQTHDLPLLQVAELGGVFAVSFAVALGNCALFLLLFPLEGRAQSRRLHLTYRDEPGTALVEYVPDLLHARARQRRLGHALCALAALLLVHAYGALRLLQLDAAQPAQALRVALVQGGMETKESWSAPGIYQRSLEAYAVPSRTALTSWQLQHQHGNVWDPAARPAVPANPAGAAPPALSRLPGYRPPTSSASSGFAPPPTPLNAPPAPSAANAPGPSTPADAAATPQLPGAPVVGNAGAENTGAPRGVTLQPPAAKPAAPIAVPAPAQPAAPTASDAAHPALLLVWPEACIPRMVTPPISASVPSEVQSVVQGHPGCGLLYGAAGNAHSMRRYENGAVLLDGHSGGQWVYSKVRLVTYGEVVPFRGLVRFLQYPWGDEDISEGRDVHPFTYAGHKLAAIVCFDNVFGFLTRRAAEEGAEGLLLITNNSWYNLTSGIRQHCDMDVLRAVETRRALGRAATTGWSQLVLPSGRIADTSRLHVQALVEQWMPLSKAPSAYTVVGDVFSQLCLLAASLLCLRVLLPGRSEGWL
jgi:apolipoprotein N-acyltransferase